MPLLGFGLGTTDQTDPFQDSVNVVPVGPLGLVPTAIQNVVLTHETPASWPASGEAAAPGVDRAKAGVTKAAAITRTVLVTRTSRPTMATPDPR